MINAINSFLFFMFIFVNLLLVFFYFGNSQTYYSFAV